MNFNWCFSATSLQLSPKNPLIRQTWKKLRTKSTRPWLWALRELGDVVSLLVSTVHPVLLCYQRLSSETSQSTYRLKKKKKEQENSNEEPRCQVHEWLNFNRRLTAELRPLFSLIRRICPLGRMKWSIVRKVVVMGFKRSQRWFATCIYSTSNAPTLQESE